MKNYELFNRCHFLGITKWKERVFVILLSNTKEAPRASWFVIISKI